MINILQKVSAHFLVILKYCDTYVKRWQKIVGRIDIVAQSWQIRRIHWRTPVWKKSSSLKYN